MQKILFVARELHKRGYEKLRVEPSISPTGLAWRCSFFVIVEEIKKSIIVSSWIGKLFMDENNKIEQSLQELTDLFEIEYKDFLLLCKGENCEYVKWYSEMLEKLQEGELPYAYSDYFSPTDFWKTSLKNKIQILAEKN